MTTLAEVLDPDYLADLRDKDLDEVRSMRDEAQRVENGVSYLRRLAQGHLDIVNHERTRRSEGGEAGDLSALIGQLPDILSEHTRGPGLGRPPQDLDPAVVPAELEASLDAIVAGADLADLPTLDDASLDDLAERLTGFEVEVSGSRQALHARIDALQDEIKRRYREGEATVDSLLS